MGNKTLVNLKWKIAEVLGVAPPLAGGEIVPLHPVSEGRTNPEGRPVKNPRLRKRLKGRGSKAGTPKNIDEFYHRGSYSRHETSVRHTPKAVMGFRGKGSKIERRSNRSRIRRIKES